MDSDREWPGEVGIEIVTERKGEGETEIRIHTLRQKFKYFNLSSLINST